MSGHVYRVTEVVGSSAEGVDDAVRTAIARAAETLHGLDWFEVTEIRGRIADGHIEEYQVGVKVGFRLDDAS
ncbi:dodecin domain-containing protein [Actinocrinis puniceicyclus]|uniref:Dodecin domain-containing protein n=1 Tax=Actinocrinis puniceicyclus TaxID=977794 RepID=A0A8J8BBI8_9ACTN|nr:dodecin [Actinocrinis puniceicyclus]MBS2963173.1 dodecin domain-containing protein [Actinocrinis puniceicyclus]